MFQALSGKILVVKALASTAKAASGEQLRRVNTKVVGNSSLAGGAILIWTSPIPRGVQYGLTALLVLSYLGRPASVLD